MLKSSHWLAKGGLREFVRKREKKEKKNRIEKEKKERRYETNVHDDQLHDAMRISKATQQLERQSQALRATRRYAAPRSSTSWLVVLVVLHANVRDV